MIEISDPSNKAVTGQIKNYDELTDQIPWNDFQVGKSVFVPYSLIQPYFPNGKEKALVYLRTFTNRKGHNLGFKFGLFDHPDKSSIEIYCRDTQEVKAFKPLGRPKKVEVVVEDRNARYDRAMTIATDRYQPAPQAGTIEFAKWSNMVLIEGTKLFNEFESQVENPKLIDIDKLPKFNPNPEPTFNPPDWRQFPPGPETDEQE